MFDHRDIEDIQELGIDQAQVMAQIQVFRQGVPVLDILRPATIGDGIIDCSMDQWRHWARKFEQQSNALEVVKFIPASGAATRMFGFLFDFLNSFDPNQHRLNTYLTLPENQAIAKFYNNLKEFPFVDLIRQRIRELYPEFKTWTKEKRFYTMVSVLVQEHGLNFGGLPKGLIPFHRYKKNIRTAFEEQLYEGAFYAATKDEVYTHFTFSPEHLEGFKNEFSQIQSRLERHTKKNYHISYSFQKDRTKTIAVDLENNPFRDDQRRLVFRPSGHGALLENLNEVNADVVFIKNIDNVIIQEEVPEMALYKKGLAGILLDYQSKIHEYLKALSSKPEAVSMEALNAFLWKSFGLRTLPKTAEEAYELLYRPLRVCGVVANTGAPGGGPFWIQDEDQIPNLQILEGAQFDKDNSRHMDVFSQATHFNPVDLVCGLRDHEGKPYDLMNYRDQGMSFIAHKTHQGKPLKALELPGLWNGAMAKWHTVFVAVPLETFNPVKTVNDLLAKAHRPLI